MDWKKLLVAIGESVDAEIWLRDACLATEPCILRQQITGRVQLNRTRGHRLLHQQGAYSVQRHPYQGIV